LPREKKMVTAVPFDAEAHDETAYRRFTKDEAVKLAAAILNCVFQMKDPTTSGVRGIFWAGKHVQVAEEPIPRKYLGD